MECCYITLRDGFTISTNTIYNQQDVSALFNIGLCIEQIFTNVLKYDWQQLFLDQS